MEQGRRKVSRPLRQCLGPKQIELLFRDSCRVGGLSRSLEWIRDVDR